MVAMTAGINEMIYFWRYIVDIPSILTYSMLCMAGVLLSGKKTGEAKLCVLQKIAIPNGVLLTMLQNIVMLHRLDDLAAVGPAASVATLVIIYGVVIYLIATLLLEYNKKEEM